MLPLAFLKSFFSNSTNVIIVILIALVALIVIPNSEIILERFGFETRASLKADLVNEKRNNEVLVSAVEEAKKKDELVKQSDNISDQNLNELTVINKKQNIETKVIIAEKNKKIKGIETFAPGENPAKKISEVQIQAIWDSYCSVDKDNCPQGVTS